jgi:3-hydroxyisobutyrate dehydrogenase-like beta-hydroxyacid dehydrogenase
MSLDPRTRSWLVIGHGSVGSVLVGRLATAGIRPAVHDPAPRIPISGADSVSRHDGRTFDVAISCVLPTVARQVLEDVRPLLRSDSLLLDWNTLAPEDKAEIAAAAPCTVVDVALMDTLDAAAAHPSLAVSGPQLDDAIVLLRALGFAVDTAGPTCGDAARLKLARSLFMKSLEALVVEFEAAMAPLPGRDIVMRSIAGNLGTRFTDFAEMLLVTDRIHATRRARELGEAIAAYRDSVASLGVPEAAVDVLGSAAAAWRLADAPAADASPAVLARHLARHLQQEGRRRAAD